MENLLIFFIFEFKIWFLLGNRQIYSSFQKIRLNNQKFPGAFFEYIQKYSTVPISKIHTTDLDSSLREKYPNTEFFLVHIFLYSDWIRRFTNTGIQENTDQKKLPISTLFTQCITRLPWNKGHSLVPPKCFMKQKYPIINLHSENLS